MFSTNSESYPQHFDYHGEKRSITKEFVLNFVKKAAEVLNFNLVKSVDQLLVGKKLKKLYGSVRTKREYVIANLNFVINFYFRSLFFHFSFCCNMDFDFELFNGS